MPIGVILGISFGVAGAVFLWCFFFMRPYLRRKIENGEPLKWYHCFYIPFVKTRMAPAPQLDTSRTVTSDKGCSDPHSPDGLKVKTMEEAYTAHEENHGEVNSSLAALDDTRGLSKSRMLFNKFKAKMTHGMDQDINKNTAEIDQIHDKSTRYDGKTELLFCTLQVLTSCFASFAHGSNDVANAIGPLTTIFYIWKNGSVDVSGKAPIPTWILAYGGIAIDIGLLTYGYKVMATLGNKITFISPSRGFAVSLGTSLTVLTCSKLGLPVSTTHCITGATTSVGLVSGGGRKSINWKMLGLVASSWVFTLPAAGLVSGLLFALIINSPHRA
ncbi:solute carrier family 20 (sodium-dependent phosphate transporter) [Entomortierella parvispora]|uniref:Solute carrier family 20 (Sodium-dependent phosphate transporter) n=1 Tax=Entomortierella parvispora TaxID=205924 RepID=A0A9P3LZ38_9FUNG|nr:solute carrier family 20 (sodium-dependent phosphate transporter) [Entomortierella parvispora]